MVNIIEISNLNLPELAVYAELSEGQLLNRHEPEKGLFIAESPKVVLRALDAGYEPVSLLVENRLLTAEDETGEILQKCGDIPVYTAEFDVLTQITGFKLTRGMLCAMHRKPLPSPEEICRNTSRIAILEDVMNPTNVGAIFRSAAALHMDAVLLTPFCSNPLYRRAIRVSMGNVFLIPWTFLDEKYVSWKENGVEYLRSLGFATASMAISDDSVSISDLALKREEKLAIILGTEGDGLSEKTIADSDYTVKIPMSPGVDSLNVAAASAVAFWELTRE
ncbi:RNA methyltransferase [Hominifimenecus microfluidus]|uniref:TrmH family RNA methyltransferase n=1 Tax=Hominifimenecus microfluidus TaxID=2885348 RepID=UPI002F9B0161